MKKTFLSSFLLLGAIFGLSQASLASTTLRDYSYIYQNTPKHNIATNGFYVYSTSRCIYSYSPSKLKNKRHERMITANNRLYGNY